MSQQLIKYSIAIPCYQEAENLAELLPQLHAAIKKLNCKYEIIVIDTHTSLNETKKVTEQNNAKCVNRSPTNDYGDAVRTAIAVARGERLLFMDADGSHSPEFVFKMLKEMEGNPSIDLLVASRYISGGDSENNKLLVGMSKLLNIAYTRMLGIHCRDISNSFKMYRISQLKAISLKSKHFDIIEEMVFNLSQKYKDLNILEIPFTFKKRIHGKSKRKFIVFIVNYFWTLCKFAIKRYLR